MQGVGTFELQFWVHMDDGTKSEAAALMLTNTKFGFIAPTVGMTLTVQLTTVNVDSVTVLYSNIGKLSAVSIKLEINNGYRVVEPTLNTFLSHKTINFPTNILGLFELRSLTLSYYNNYIYAGITPVFIPPQAAELESVAYIQ